MKKRVPVPTVLQMEAVECGAAALAMILAYHGRHVPLDELRILCGVSRDGSKATHILRAARRHRLRAQAYKREPAELRALPLPLIVHWNFNHFVVIEGFGRGKVFLNDPAAGPRTVSESEFDASFTGVVLTFAPDSGFERTGRPRGIARALSERLTGARAAIVYIVSAGALLVMPSLIAPAFLRIFVDEILIKQMTSWTTPLLAAMIATAGTTGAATWLQQHHLLRLETKFALSTSSRFFWHLLRLPIGFFVQRYPGEISTRVILNDHVAQLLSGELAATALSVLTIVLYVVLMLRYDVLLTAIAVLAAVANVAVVKYAANQRLNLSRRLLQEQGQLMATAMGGLQSIETLKAMGMEADFFSRWSGYQAKVLDVQQQLRLRNEVLASIPPFLNTAATVVILGVGGSRVMDGAMSIGMLVAFHALAMAFIAPVQRLVDIAALLHEVGGELDRLDDVMTTETDERVTPMLEPTAKLTGELVLRNVSFGYNLLEPPLLDQLSLTIPAGGRVAIVGASGSGKSTIARLVCGLYRPWSGQILIDGVPLDSLSHPQLSRSLAAVDQDIFLFEGTVRDNLTLWQSSVPEVDLTRAATDACIHDDVMSRPEGYLARVDEGGANFSGGQRQRLEIARALVGNPSVIVLDEATAALDPVTEKIVDENLKRRGCTCLLIAHRLSTIRDCDEIIVLDRGRIVQRGTHDAMKHQPGPYANLIALEAAA